jgi:MFS family permease
VRPTATAPAPTSFPPDTDPSRWRMLALLAASELLGMSLWFSGSAIGPQLQLRWSLSPSAVGWLTTMVQLGFVAGTALSALLNLADLVPARRLFAIAAVGGAIANALFATTDSYEGALVLRCITGFCLAGVYPPAMKMAATWFRARRGLAIGTVVGALTIGKATPYLVHALPQVSAAHVVLTASVGALIAAALVWFGYRDGPYLFPARPFSWGLVASVIRDRRWRLATGGYLGHMAELYAFWTWIPAFLLASAAHRAGVVVLPSSSAVTALSFAVIAVGGIGCVWGGLAADRLGRERLVNIAMAVSGSCALLIGFAFGASWWILAPVALVWGVFVIADSAQFSVLVTESVPAHAVGTALTIQTSLGFLLTTLTIQLVPPVVALVGWRWAFPMLAIGPALGIASIRALVRSRTTPAPIAA